MKKELQPKVLQLKVLQLKEKDILKVAKDFYKADKTKSVKVKARYTTIGAYNDGILLTIGFFNTKGNLMDRKMYNKNTDLSEALYDFMKHSTQTFNENDFEIFTKFIEVLKEVEEEEYYN